MSKSIMLGWLLGASVILTFGSSPVAAFESRGVGQRRVAQAPLRQRSPRQCAGGGPDGLGSDAMLPGEALRASGDAASICRNSPVNVPPSATTSLP